MSSRMKRIDSGRRRWWLRSRSLRLICLQCTSCERITSCRSFWKLRRSRRWCCRRRFSPSWVIERIDARVRRICRYWRSRQSSIRALTLALPINGRHHHRRLVLLARAAARSRSLTLGDILQLETFSVPKRERAGIQRLRLRSLDLFLCASNGCDGGRLCLVCRCACARRCTLLRSALLLVRNMWACLCLSRCLWSHRRIALRGDGS